MHHCSKCDKDFKQGMFELHSCMTDHKQEIQFFSTEKCYSCRYSLRANMPFDWASQTSCPSCKKSFID